MLVVAPSLERRMRDRAVFKAFRLFWRESGGFFIALVKEKCRHFFVRQRFHKTASEKMQIGLFIKRLARVYLGVFVVIACSIGLVCFFAAKSNREAGSLAAKRGGARNHNRGGRVYPHGSRTSAAAISDSERLADSNHMDKPGSTNSAPELFGAAANLNENEEAEDLTDEEVTSEDIAALKERLIREKFGVINRQGKWIPTTGGGTNLVYITTGSLPPGRVGELYDVQFLATSGFQPYLWSVVGGKLPGSLSFDSQSGKLSGIPTEPTTVDFFLQVTDRRGAKDVAEYVLTFQPEQSLEIVTASLPAAFPGEDYVFQLQAAGGVPPYAWSAAGNLEEIGALALDSQTGKLQGKIDASSPKVDIPLVFWLSDAQLHVTKELVLHCRTELSILDIPQSSIRESEPFELAFQATGGVEPYVWGISGSLPPGIEFSAAGLCSGTPSESGTYEISVGVQDAEGQLDNVQLALEVLPRLSASISKFEALLSRNSVALSWVLTAMSGDLSVRIVRSSTGTPLTPSDGSTVYCGPETSYLDGDVGEGNHYYAAFLESNGTMATSAASPKIFAKLPPETEPFADRVVSKNLLHPNAFRSAELPQIVLGAPRGKGLVWGSTDVVSLGAAINDDGGASAPYGGTITLEFVDNVVWDGPGADFTVFENVFYVCDAAGVPDPETRFMEPAVVSVSQDGINWRQFKIDFSPRYDPDTGALNLRHPYCYNSGFAGVNPVMSDGYSPDPTDPAVSGGDSFDISAVGLEWIRYVRIQSTGSRWLIDNDGDLVYHNEETGAATRSNNKSGFDLDAVTAIWMKKVESQ
ncbi:MAG: Ig domain-containing protein [Kiritimatiellia bacterium]|jgi:hypothetical protein